MDFVNAIYLASLVFILFRVYKIPLNYYLIIISHLALVFLTNDFLFSPSYMPDQFRYLSSASDIRETLDFMNYELYDRSAKVAFSGLLFALSPIPFIDSLFSISMINFLLYAILFIFLFRKKILVGNALWFYLLFPSLALYSAVALRDTWILLFMILSVYALYRGKTILSILIALPLLLIKSQNFLIFIVALIVYKGMEKGNFFSVKTLFKLLIVGAILVALGSLFPISELNHIRQSMYLEDGGDILNYIPLAGYGDFLRQGFLGTFSMILKPLPWEVSGIMQLMQSIENIFIFYLLFKIVQRQRIVKDKFVSFLLIYFFVGMLIYGLVIFNFGTAARYRYTFEVVLIVFSMSIFYKDKRQV